MAEQTRIVVATVLDEDTPLSLEELCRSVALEERELVALVEEGVLEPAGADPRHVVALLDGIPGAFERAQQGLKQARAGRTIDLDEL